VYDSLVLNEENNQVSSNNTSDGIFKKIQNESKSKKQIHNLGVEKCYSELVMQGARACFYVSNMRGIIPNTNNKVYSTPYFFLFKENYKQNKQEKFFIPLKYLKKATDIMTEMVERNEQNFIFVE